jgi:hypothetical protein
MVNKITARKEKYYERERNKKYERSTPGRPSIMWLNVKKNKSIGNPDKTSKYQCFTYARTSTFE